MKSFVTGLFLLVLVASTLGNVLLGSLQENIIEGGSVSCRSYYVKCVLNLSS